MSMFTADSNNPIIKRFLGGSLIIMGMSILARVVGLFKEIIVAREFGLSEDLDVYFLAIMIPSYLIVSLTNPLGPVFISAFNLEEKKEENKAQILFSKVLSALVLAAVSLGVLYYIALPGIASLLHIESKNFILFSQVSLVFIGVLIVQSLANYLLAYLENRKLFILTSLGTLFSSIFVMIAILWFGGIMSIAYGMLVATILFLTVELMILFYRNDVAFRFAIPGNWPSGFSKQYTWLLLASLTMGSTLVVDQYMASYFEISSVSGLNYGAKVAGIFTGLGALSLGAVALPVFSQLVASHESAKLKQLLNKILQFIVLISLPSILVLYFISDDLISFLFERGSFKSSNVDLVSEFFKLYILQLPFYVAGVVLSRLMASLRKNKIVFVVSLIGLILNVLLNIYFTQIMGVVGIALSTSVVYFVTFTCLFYFARRELNSEL